MRTIDRVHVAIDLTGMMPVPTGVDVYMKQIVLSVARVDRRNRYTVLLSRGSQSVFQGALPNNFVKRVITTPHRPVRACVQQFLLPGIARASRFDVIHSPAFLKPLLSAAPRHLLSVHDATFFHMPEVHNALRSSRPFLWAVRKSIRTADRITVPSRATRDALLQEIRDLPASRVRVIPLGIDTAYSPGDPRETQAALDRLGIQRPYMLFVGTLEPRKNLGLLLESYRMLAAAGKIREHLVLAGQTGWGPREWENTLAAPELRGRVHRLGYVPDEQLLWLYRGAGLFVYPSLCEGFGLPPLEAMACGAPVVAAGNSALAENLAGAAELVRAGDVDALASAIHTVLGSVEASNRYRALGLERAAAFRWETTAARTVELYEELAEPRKALAK